jgi:hypothetical protein
MLDWVITDSPDIARSLRMFMSKHPTALRFSSAAESSTQNLEQRVKYDALGLSGPYQIKRIHIGPHP